jgi:hypothetical protein
MQRAIDIRRHAIVAATFAVIVGIGYAGANWLGSRDVPDPLQDCIKKCANVYRDGRLVYDGPVGAKSSYRNAHSVCECR